MPLSWKWKFTIVGLSTFLLVVLSWWGISYFLKYVRGMYQPSPLALLDHCHRGMADKILHQDHDLDGGQAARKMLPGMLRPVCPGQGGEAALSDEPRMFIPEDFQPGGPAEVLNLHGMISERESRACLQYTISDNDDLSLREGVYFICHAWTDLDDDGQIAHWQKMVTYQADSGTFKAGHVWHDDQSGDW